MEITVSASVRLLVQCNKLLATTGVAILGQNMKLRGSEDHCIIIEDYVVCSRSRDITYVSIKRELSRRSPPYREHGYSTLNLRLGTPRHSSYLVLDPSIPVCAGIYV